MSAGHGWDFEEWPEPAGTVFRVRHFSEIDSTNRYLADLAAGGETEGVVAFADHQSAGRGRLGRTWLAPPGSNLLVSVLLRPRLRIEELFLCTVAVGLSALHACKDVAGLQPALKWPNDLVVGEKKLGGILAEVVPSNKGQSVSGAQAVVVGLGLNVRWPGPGDRENSGADVAGTKVGAAGPQTEETVPEELRANATSLWVERGRRLAPSDLLGPLLIGLAERIEDMSNPDRRGSLVDDYRRSCSTIGKEVEVDAASGKLSGRAVEVTELGTLVIETSGGLRQVSVGDVVHVRPA